MNELIEKLNENFGCDFKKYDENSFECDATGSFLLKDFGEYEIQTGHGVLRFREFDFEHDKFRAFVLGTTVFEIDQRLLYRWLKGDN